METAITGHVPAPVSVPVDLIYFVLYLGFNPCYKDLRKTWKLADYRNNLRQALPSDLRGLPLEWTYEDEEDLRYNVADTPVRDAQGLGAAVGLLRLLPVVFDSLFPVKGPTLHNVFILAMVYTVSGAIAMQVIKIMLCKQGCGNAFANPNDRLLGRES